MNQHFKTVLVLLLGENKRDGFHQASFRPVARAGLRRTVGTTPPRGHHAGIELGVPVAVFLQVFGKGDELGLFFCQPVQQFLTDCRVTVIVEQVVTFLFVVDHVVQFVAGERNETKSEHTL